MKKNLLRMVAVSAILSFLVFAFPARSQAQQSATDSFKPHGKFSGYMFGDYFYKAHSDSLNRGSYQYSKVPQGQNAFQIRRVYLGYTYDISPKFTATVLVAAEDATDALADGKYAFYIKQANLRWKNIIPRGDLIVGQMSTPTFATMSEHVWGYRSVEKTITDMHKSGSYDLGAMLEGNFDAKGHYGYHLMVGNGTGAKPETDKFKKFYGDVYGKFLDNKLTVDLYADYERAHWQQGFHNARAMYKGFVSYSMPKLTLGVETYGYHLIGDEVITPASGGVADTASGTAYGLSVFAHGPIVAGKLGFFARYDHLNPNTQYMQGFDYHNFTSGYDPNNKEQFILAGLDFTPNKAVHIMPNVYYQAYKAQQSGLSGAAQHDYDLVYRVTFMFSLN